MQHSNSSSRYSSIPFSFLFEEARSRARGTSAPMPDAAPSADQRVGPAPVRVGLAELLGVLHGPVEWVFSLAERAALGDSVDISAIHRVRDAVRVRMVAAATDVAGNAPMERPRIRPADVLTVSGLLISTLDPATVQHVALCLGTRAADLFTAILQAEPALIASFVSPAAVPPPMPTCGCAAASSSGHPPIL